MSDEEGVSWRSAKEPRSLKVAIMNAPRENTNLKSVVTIRRQKGNAMDQTKCEISSKLRNTDM